MVDVTKESDCPAQETGTTRGGRAEAAGTGQGPTSLPGTSAGVGPPPITQGQGCTQTKGSGRPCRLSTQCGCVLELTFTGTFKGSVV